MQTARKGNWVQKEMETECQGTAVDKPAEETRDSCSWLVKAREPEVGEGKIRVHLFVGEGTSSTEAFVIVPITGGTR